MRNNQRSKIFQFKQLERRSMKKIGFNGIRTRDLRDTGAMLNQLSYEATHFTAMIILHFVLKLLM